VTRTDAPRCLPEELVSAVVGRIGGWKVCVVTNDKGVVQGLLAPTDVEAGEEVRAESVMLLGPRTIRPSARRDAIARRMEKQGIGRLLVTYPDGVFVGVVLREDL
jgi:CBS domain-containing protein